MKSQDGIAAIVQTKSVSRGGNADPIPQWEERPESKSHCDKSLWGQNCCYRQVWKREALEAETKWPLLPLHFKKCEILTGQKESPKTYWAL